MSATENQKRFTEAIREHRWADVLRAVASDQRDHLDLRADNDMLLREAAKANQHELLAILMEDYRLDLSVNNHAVLCWAAVMGHTSLAALVVASYARQYAKPKAMAEFPLLAATIKNHSQIVELLLKNGMAEVAASNSTLASDKNANQELVEALLASKPWPYVGNGAALVLAVIFGHLDVAKLLLAHLREHAPSSAAASIATTALQHAAKHGRLEMVQFLLTKDDDVTPESDENFAACEAAKNGHVSVLRVLLADARVAKADFREDLLLAAAKKGLDEIVKLMLELRNVLKMKIDAEAALCEALRNGHVETARLLIADPRTDCATKNNFPIRWASKHGCESIVKMLLVDEKRADPAALMNYAISAACTGGHLDVVGLLLNDKRVDPAAVENYPLHCAIKCGHHMVVKLLLTDPRVDPAAKANDGILVTAALGHSKVLKLLLADARVDPTVQDNKAIQDSAKGGHAECVYLLLADKRVDPAVNDNAAIRLASSGGQAECVRLLLSDTRVDPTANDSQALRAASQGGHADCVTALLADKRSDPAAINNEAILQCAKNGYAACLKVLLADERTDPAAQGNVAVEYAAVGGHVDSLKLLLSDARIDPTAKNNAALLEALMISQDAAAECLINDQRVRDSLNDRFIPGSVIRTETGKKIEKFLLSNRVVLNNKRLKVFMDQECCICHCDFRANAPVVVGQCGHMTCEPCGARIERCPVCREPCTDFTDSYN